MTRIYGLPQPLTGSETVTVHQEQNGQIAQCTMPLSTLAAFLGAPSGTPTFTSLPVVLPSTAGVVWNNAGLISIS